MRKRKVDGGTASPKRTRRAFTEEFKQDAVQLLRDRRAAGASLTQVARELDVGPNLLREWAEARTARDATTGAPIGAVETPEQELRRLRREIAVLRQVQEFAKKVAVYFAKGSR